MKRKAILFGLVSLFVAGQASAKVMDTWTRATPEARFGFYLPGSETLEVSNFRYDSLTR